jgi:hypothetical protein
MATQSPTTQLGDAGLRLASVAWTGVVATLFCAGFFFLKHDAEMRRLIPFASDPFDAVGSFAVLGSAPLGALALLRAWRLEPGDADGKVALARTQLAILLGIALTSFADLIAMGQRYDRWIHGFAAPGMIALVGSGLALSLPTIWAIARTLPARGDRAAVSSLILVVVSLALFGAALWLFARGSIVSLPSELQALVFGCVWLFWQMRLWLFVLAPAAEPQRPQAPSAVMTTLALAAGALIGAALFALEAAEPGGVLKSRFLLVATVFIGAGSSGAAIGYVFLRKPLRLP